VFKALWYTPASSVRFPTTKKFTPLGIDLELDGFTRLGIRWRGRRVERNSRPRAELICRAIFFGDSDGEPPNTLLHKLYAISPKLRRTGNNEPVTPCSLLNPREIPPDFHNLDTHSIRDPLIWKSLRGSWPCDWSALISRVVWRQSGPMKWRPCAIVAQQTRHVGFTSRCYTDKLSGGRFYWNAGARLSIAARH
jgi:hypothetical protein